MFEIFNSELGELLRSIVLMVPLVLVLASDPGVHASQEFPVFRMQQYDLPTAGGGGGHLGSRANTLSMEARTITSKPSFISRRCVLVKLDDFTLDRYRSLVGNYVGAIIVILPTKFTSAQRHVVLGLEASLLHEEVKIPVYFIRESAELLEYYDDIDSDKSSQADSSAAQVLVDSVLSNGFQFVINSAQAKQLGPSDYQAVNIQGKLNGGLADSVTSDESRAGSRKIPTVLIVAHYDAFGLATSLSYGCDSNGSGVVALLELSRILSYLYADSKTIPAINLVFLLTAHGKFNYYGLKKWIDEQSFRNEMAGKIDLDDVEFAICLDSLGRSEAADGRGGLFMHFSKPPKEGQSSYEFLKSFEKVGNRTNFRFDTVHKKINLASEQLAWEHEKFSLNKIPAFTLSHHQSHRNAERNTMTDTIDTVEPKVLTENIQAIARTIIQYMYKNEDIPESLLTGDLEISEEFVSSWLKQICSVPRSTSLLNKNHPLVNNLHSHFNHYLHESVKLPVKIPQKEAEFVLYNEEQATLVIYNVKPAPFDLFLSLLITGYIGLVYLFVLNFDKIFVLLNRSVATLKSSPSNGAGQKAKSN